MGGQQVRVLTGHTKGILDLAMAPRPPACVSLPHRTTAPGAYSSCESPRVFIDPTRVDRPGAGGSLGRVIPPAGRAANAPPGAELAWNSFFVYRRALERRTRLIRAGLSAS